MDQLNRYRAIIKKTLTERAELMRSQPLPGEEVVCLLDEATDNYVLVRLGWLQDGRLYSVTLHLRLVNGMVAIEQDWTDDFLEDLLAEGISREHIVFAMHPTETRPRPELAAI